MRLSHLFKRQLTDIQDMFFSEGLTAYLAGGAVRDAELGGVPKDYDLIIPMGPDTSSHHVTEVMAELEGRLELQGFAVKHCEHSFDKEYVTDPDFEDRLWYVVKVSRAGYDFDLIVSKSRTIHEAVRKFDCTINQCWYELTGELVDVGGIFAKHQEILKAELTTVRAQRLGAIALKYNKVLVNNQAGLSMRFIDDNIPF